jgi:hypothetical protein
VTVARFHARAGVVTGSRPSTTRDHRVTVTDGRLRVTVCPGPGTLLDVAVERLAAEPLGRAGVTVVRVDDSPLRVDFTRRDRDPSSRAVATARRVGHGLVGRWTRHRFLRSLRRGRS